MKKYKICSFLLSIIWVFMCIPIFPKGAVIPESLEKADVSISARENNDTLYVAKKIKTKQYTISKPAGTYSSQIKIKMKAKKGYKVYYSLNGKFKKKNIIKSKKKKVITIPSTKTLQVYAVKSSKKITAKLLKKKAVKQAKKYIYTIEQTNTTPISTPTPALNQSSGDTGNDQANTCTITFNSNRGSFVDSQMVTKGSTVSAPKNPVRDGYIFTGWYTSKKLDEVFLFDEDIIDMNITLYAGWVLDDKDAILVEYAARQINIIYEQGDDSEHVTRNVTLPTEVEGAEDVTIVWSSSSENITAEGIVTRPQGHDATVTLTATVSKNNAEYSVDFHLNVIYENNRNVSDITNNSVADIENMNPDGDITIFYNEDKTQITSIEGKYSEITVENADDALDVIQSVHSVVGIDNPYEELDILVINSNEYGAEYTFAQKYDDHQVYGRRITVSVDENGVTDSLSSDVYSSEKLSNVNNIPQITAENAEKIAIDTYGGKCEVDATATVLAYYTLEEYSDNPVLTYMINVSGNDAEGNYVNETIFINAANGSIIKTYTNIMNISTATGSGKNEFGQKVSFPIAFTWTDWYFYYMQNLDRNIQMYNRFCSLDFRIGSELNWWTDKTAISAYTNTIKTYDWYKSKLNRDSVDGEGLALKVIIHNNDLYYDNAYWDRSTRTINFCDNSQGSSLKTTAAAGLDIVAHEYTHGVVQFITGGLPSSNATGAINEGYADIFGCLIDGDWQMGEDWYILRDMSNPTKYKAPDRMSSPFYVDYTINTGDDEEDDENDNGGVHINSSLVYYPAYLMIKYGMSKDTLAKLWYESLGMGYGATSTFQTVRINVLKAARKMKLSDLEIERIKKAFDEVEIYGPRDTSKIPSDALLFDGHYYKFYNENSMDWEDAEIYCESLDGHLVTITSEEEQNAVFQYFDSFNFSKDVWIGISDKENEGDWSSWVTGEKVIYTNWGVGEPDNYNGQGQDYGVISPVHRSGSGFEIEPGQWDDIDNNSDTASGYFICEWDE